MDDDLRSSERAWRAAPDDPLAHERWIEARLRAGIAVGHEELDARLHPAREYVFARARPAPADAARGRRLVRRNPDRAISQRARRAAPGGDSQQLHVRVRGGAGTTLWLDRTSGQAAELLLPALTGASWTHVRLPPLPAPCAELLQLVAALPRLTSLWLTQGPAGPDVALAASDLRPVGSAPGLTRLELASVLVSSGALPAAAGRSLRELKVSERWSGSVPMATDADEELDALLRAAPALRRLDLRGAHRLYSAAGLRALVRSAPSLTALSLPECMDLDDAGVEALAGLDLRELTLTAPLVTDAAVRILVGLPLQRLDLDSPHFSAEGLSQLSGTRAEVRLRLDSAAQLPGLAAFDDRLRALTLDLESPPSEQTLSPVSQLPALHELEVNYPVEPPARADTLEPVGDCRALRRLSLNDAPTLTPSFARRLCAVPLESLTIHAHVGRREAWTDALLELARHPTLRSLELTEVPGCNEALEAFAATTRLRLLVLRACPQVTLEGVEALRRAGAGRLRVWFHE